MKTRIVYKKRKNANGKVKIIEREEIAPSKKPIVIRNTVLNRKRLQEELDVTNVNIEKFKERRRVLQRKLNMFDEMEKESTPMDREEIVLPDDEKKARKSKK